MPAKARTAKPRKPAAENPLSAEAQRIGVDFTWRGVTIHVDPRTMQIGRAMYCIRVASNEALPMTTRLGAVFDLFEATIGAEQTQAAYEAVPTLFDDIDVMMDLWRTAHAAAIGGTPGE
jgi:hypothetical protein